MQRMEKRRVRGTRRPDLSDVVLSRPPAGSLPQPSVDRTRRDAIAPSPRQGRYHGFLTWHARPVFTM